eukprot:gnl/Spiro4/13348_TR7103_c0_g1_i1.p1 gnl/Spiro4/13348_TR7103_c0_g1~~gnl/Spiro4/13348_TR7103_c0_g1_i1.p1  ORF type:complete len:188 (+),score=30.68 gnl/Spiro4/13348_TR7103_c0_g1_i1:32-565(+)
MEERHTPETPPPPKPRWSPDPFLAGQGSQQGDAHDILKSIHGRERLIREYAINVEELKINQDLLYRCVLMHHSAGRKMCRPLMIEYLGRMNSKGFKYDGPPGLMPPLDSTNSYARGRVPWFRRSTEPEYRERELKAEAVHAADPTTAGLIKHITRTGLRRELIDKYREFRRFLGFSL